MTHFRALGSDNEHAFMGQFLPAAFLPGELEVIGERGMSWLRVEGAARDPELTEGLAARVADPLWFLARQWQVGEFHGEDASSPILVTATIAHTPLTAFAPGRGDGKEDALDRADADRPLEVLVEQESTEDDIRLPLEQGWVLLHSLVEAGARVRSSTAGGALSRPRCRRIASRSARTGSMGILARRSIDGAALAAELRADPNALPDLFDRIGVSRDRRTAISRIFTGWLNGVQDAVRTPSTSSCWREKSLEYQFRVSAPLGESEMRSTLPSIAEGRSTGTTSDGRRGEAARRRRKAQPQDDHAAADAAALPRDARAPFSQISRTIRSHWAISRRHPMTSCAPSWGLSPPFTTTIGSRCRVLPSGSIARIERIVVHDDYGKSHEIRATAVNDGPDPVGVLRDRRRRRTRRAPTRRPPQSADAACAGARGRRGRPGSRTD